MSKNEKQIMERLDRLEELICGVVEKLEGLEKLTYDVTTAAEAMGISRHSMYNLIHKEGFPTLFVGGRRLISKELLAEWVRTQAGGSAQKSEVVSG